MSFLELGVFVLGVAIGLIFSFLGLGALPGWSLAFVLQVLFCLTGFPLLFLLVVAFICSYPDDGWLASGRRLAAKARESAGHGSGVTDRDNTNP